jgi:hypothetical protein
MNQDEADAAAKVASEFFKIVSDAFGPSIIAAIESQSVDAGVARMIEKLSDMHLAAKQFPDGRYVPPIE